MGIALEKEQEDKKEAEQSVANYKRQLASLREKCASIDVEIEQYRAITANLHRGKSNYARPIKNSPSHSTMSEKNKERSTLNSHAAYASPELKTCEHRLRCVIEGIEKDQLLIRFSHIDKSDLAREFSFVLDVGARLYKGASSFRVHVYTSKLTT